MCGSAGAGSYFHIFDSMLPERSTSSATNHELAQSAFAATHGISEIASVERIKMGARRNVIPD